MTVPQVQGKYVHCKRINWTYQIGNKFKTSIVSLFPTTDPVQIHLWCCDQESAQSDAAGRGSINSHTSEQMYIFKPLQFSFLLWWLLGFCSKTGDSHWTQCFYSTSPFTKHEFGIKLGKPTLKNAIFSLQFLKVCSSISPLISLTKLKKAPLCLNC